ncbi:MAG: ROK family protein [Actinomycetota bacterium]|nr:ROK family protein [Actinomycetota bacterium]
MTATVGIDMGGTKLLAVRIEDGDVVAREVFTTPGEDMIGSAIAAIRELWTEDVTAVGAGIAGLVRFLDGVFVWGPHLPGANVPIRRLLEAEFGVPAAVDNDANAAALAELQYGAARGRQDVLLVTLGTGIGGAIVADGQVYRGSSFAGEWGHMLYQENGLQCDCGKRGCWETVASGPALARLGKEFISLNPEGQLARVLAQGDFTAETITASADAGNETARGLVSQVGAALGRGLCSLIAVFDPELVVVGGGLGSVGESLLGPARRVAADAIHGGSYRPLPPIVVAELGPESGAIGAALLAAKARDGHVSAFLT